MTFLTVYDCIYTASADVRHEYRVVCARVEKAADGRNNIILYHITITTGTGNLKTYQRASFKNFQARGLYIVFE